MQTKCKLSEWKTIRDGRGREVFDTPSISKLVKNVQERPKGYFGCEMENCNLIETEGIGQKIYTFIP
jgi:hypothetical protein